MEVDAPVPLPHRRLHAKRSNPRDLDSPAYDASEEDNDPLSDDNTRPRATRTNTTTSINKHTSRRHHLANNLALSDSGDGFDSPTYDGDIESSATAGPEPFSTLAPPAKDRPTHHHHASSTSTFNSEANTIPDDRFTTPAKALREPAPAAASLAAFNPAALTPEDIRAYVQKAIDGEAGRAYKINPPPVGRPARVYADGVYDLFHFGHALQLRQAKMSFESVYLLVGVNSDEQVRDHKARGIMTHAERLEGVRHCRWVDEVIADAPWIITQSFIDKHQIDYVAHDEVPYAAVGHDDVYGFCKAQGIFLPTRRTPGVSTSELLERIVSGYRHRDFDEKLVKMGHAELKAEGSDYDDSRRPSRVGSARPSRVGSPVQGQHTGQMGVC